MPYIDPKRRKEWGKEWRLKHPDKVKAAKQRFKDTHPKWDAEYQKTWHVQKQLTERHAFARRQLMKWGLPFVPGTEVEVWESEIKYERAFVPLPAGFWDFVRLNDRRSTLAEIQAGTGWSEARIRNWRRRTGRRSLWLARHRTGIQRLRRWTLRTARRRGWFRSKRDLAISFHQTKGRCICGQRIRLGTIDRREKACLDHCHKTGKFRGWLCSGCNTAAGLAGDDPRRLIALARYLTNFIIPP
jgi:Recombination endonuclease VII